MNPNPTIRNYTLSYDPNTSIKLFESYFLFKRQGVCIIQGIDIVNLSKGNQQIVDIMTESQTMDCHLNFTVYRTGDFPYSNNSNGVIAFIFERGSFFHQPIVTVDYLDPIFGISNQMVPPDTYALEVITVSNTIVDGLFNEMNIEQYGNNIFLTTS